MTAARNGHGGRYSIGCRQEVALADRVGASWRGRPVGRMAGRLPAPPSGWEWHGPQSGQGAFELGFSGPALGQMQGGRRAERVSRPAIEKNRRRRVLVVSQLLARTDAHRPAVQVMCA